MSIQTETADERHRQWKLDLDASCSAWMESHPENVETLRPQLTAGDEYRYENGSKAFTDSASKLLPGGEREKVIVSEILDGVWGVKIGTTLVDAFRGPDARQKALDKGTALADAQKRRI
jgi:hypothetical protein